MKKLSKRQQEIVDKLNNGYVFVTNTQVAVLSSSDKSKPDDYIQLALFWRMERAGIIYQRLERPFDFILSEQYIKP